MSSPAQVDDDDDDDAEEVEFVSVSSLTSPLSLVCSQGYISKKLCFADPQF